MVLLIVLSVLTGLVGAGVAGVTITVFLHRGITHGAIGVTRPLYEAGRWLTWLTTFMRHWEWRVVHRKHHLYTDVWLDDIRHDPHSPVLISEREGIDGFRRVSWHMAAIFHAEAKLPDIQDGTYDLPSDRPLDRLDRLIFARPVVGAVTTGVLYAVGMALVVPWLIGAHRTIGLEILCLLGGVAALGIHIGLVLRFGGAINSDCHRADRFVEGAAYAKNVRLLSILIFGEGEHYTHHRYPHVAQISRRWDLGWRVIQVLRLLRITHVAVERRELHELLVS